MSWSWKRPSIPEKYHPWLEENRWWLQLATLFITALVIAISFRRGAWLDWVGFRDKTVWDWLSLLGVPLTLAILGYALQQQERNRAETLSREQRERDEKLIKEQREIAANETKEEILQSYFDRLSTLLIDKNILALAAKVYLPSENQGDEQLEKIVTPEEQELFDSAIDVIRARTLSILRRFEDDAERKTSVISFLLEAEIIVKTKLNLSGVNLSGVNLSGVNLSGVNLSGVNLSGANLSRAGLNGADLSGAVLRGANLSGANLNEANLFGANLCITNLEGANLSRADLSGADLSGADLSGADLFKANLSRASLSRANLSGADLYAANLERANLQGANLSRASLIRANLSGADLIWAKLIEADLGGAKLTGAVLSGAILEGADLTDIKWNDETQWPDTAEVAKALNIPEALKQQLGLTDTPPPTPAS